jgi:hypothetical protein
MSKKRRTYLPRIVGDKVMMPADLKRLHKYMVEVEHGPSWRTSCHRRSLDAELKKAPGVPGLQDRLRKHLAGEL